MVSMKLEDAKVHRMRLIPGLQLQVILLILSGAPGRGMFLRYRIPF